MQIVNNKTFCSHRRRIGFILLEKWVFANVIAELFCLGIIGFVGTTVSSKSNANSQDILVLIGIFQGFILGFTQWFALRRYIRNPIWWVLATAIGWLLGWFAMLFVAIIAAITIALAPNGLDIITLLIGVVWLGAAVGILVGLAQALVFVVCFKIPIYKAAWWMNSNALGWALRFLLGFVTAVSIKAGLSYTHTALIIMLTGTLVLLIPGLVTGIVLVYLLQSSLRKRHSFS